MTTRTASATWNGTLLEGSGTITNVESGAIGALPVSWPRRSEAHEGVTSPEELLAAAHAACFAMALSGALARNTTPAERLDVSATIAFEKVEAGWRVTSSKLKLKGVVPGLDAAKFAEIAEGAKGGCPISSALAGNVAISLEIVA
ncbi:MAG: OsmC family peroxiredoxin [Candidatus Limnocylindrus sp.]|jgi:osmotically inducible protein OsmC